MTHPHVFEPAVSTAKKWLDQIMTSLDLPAGDEGRALHALRAGLHSIRDRLPANEVIDLGAQLPTLIRGLYFEGWSLNHDPGKIRDRAAMLERVQKELAPDLRLEPIDVLRSVIELLTEHVSVGELKDIVATLPKPIANLWQDLTGHALDSLPARYPHRTGYAR